MSNRCKKLTGKVLKVLGESLQSLLGLKSLNLGVAWWDKINDESLKNLGDFLGKLSMLESLELDFSG